MDTTQTCAKSLDSDPFARHRPLEPRVEEVLAHVGPLPVLDRRALVRAAIEALAFPGSEFPDPLRVFDRFDLDMADLCLLLQAHGSSPDVMRRVLAHRSCEQSLVFVAAEKAWTQAEPVLWDELAAYGPLGYALKAMYSRHGLLTNEFECGALVLADAGDEVTRTAVALMEHLPFPEYVHAAFAVLDS